MNRNEALAWLEKQGTRRTVEGMARYGIEAKRAFGVPMGTLLKLKKQMGTDHELSLALWESGWYEARLLAALVGDPQRVTRRQMNAWAAGFENWADCDTVCFKLFDRSPFAWEKAREWAASPRELVKRALRADGVPGSPRQGRSRQGLPGHAAPHREGGARRAQLREEGCEALKVARRLTLSEEAACRWVGKDAARELCRFHRSSIDESL